MHHILKYSDYIIEHKNNNLPKELQGKKQTNHINGYDREHTTGIVNLQDLKILSNGIKIAKKTFILNPKFNISKNPIVVGVDVKTGKKQLLDGYHRYFYYGGTGNHKAIFIPMLNGIITTFDKISENKTFKQLKNSNKSVIFKKEDLLQLAYYVIKVLPKDAIKELFNWNIIAKSPWSYSFYNTEDLSWTHKELNSLRIADHWSFKTTNPRFDTNKIHTPTDIGTKNKTWYLGKWDGEKYNILKEYDNIFYNNIAEILSDYPFIKDLVKDNKESQIQYQKDVNNGLIKAIVYIDGNKIEGTLTKSGGDRFVIDNDLTLRKYTGHINYKPFTIELYKNNELIRSETH